MSEQSNGQSKWAIWYNKLNETDKEQFLKKRRDKRKHVREKARIAKENIALLHKEKETLKRQNDDLLRKVVTLSQTLNLHPTFSWENDHDPLCPRYKSRGIISNGRNTRSVPRLAFSSIVPLKEGTSFHVYIGSHNGPALNLKKERMYHKNLWLPLQIQKHKAIIFDGNLCHAGGSSDKRCPRMFCTFGSSYSTLEGETYGQECLPCDFEGV